jgi:hypothetical protein
MEPVFVSSLRGDESYMAFANASLGQLWPELEKFKMAKLHYV